MNTHQKAKDIAAGIIGILDDRHSRHPAHANKSLEEAIAYHLESELDSIVEELAPDPAE